MRNEKLKNILDEDMAKASGDKKSVLKSIWAVMAGFLTVVVLSIATDALLEGFGILPPASRPDQYVSWMLFVALIYRLAYNIVGGYVTAYLAPSNPMKHVKILAIFGTIGGVMGVIFGWNISENWYPIALAAASYPTVMFGGKLRIKKV